MMSLQLQEFVYLPAAGLVPRGRLRRLARESSDEKVQAKAVLFLVCCCECIRLQSSAPWSTSHYVKLLLAPTMG
jgi:hypothetical protein